MSIGTEFALVRNKLSWGSYPLCTGYMGTGIVEAVGSDIASCVHRGCKVVAIDIDDGRLVVAQKLGADVAINGQTTDVYEALKSIRPEGADVVFECTGIPQCIDPAIALCREHGSFVWQGNYGSEPVSMQFLPPHGRRLKMFFPCDDGLQTCRWAVVKNMAMGALQWEHCISHRIGWGEAPAMFQRLNEGAAENIVGVVINWQS